MPGLTSPLRSGPRCAHHPDRPAHARCMECFRNVCRECATEWEGINYCVRCLGQRRKTATARSSLASYLGLLLACALLLALGIRTLAWCGAVASQLL